MKTKTARQQENLRAWNLYRAAVSETGPEYRFAKEHGFDVIIPVYRASFNDLLDLFKKYDALV